MLDAENKASFNSSSVITNVDVSDANMADVTNLQLGDEEMNGMRTYSQDVQSGLYDKRTV